MVKGTLKNSAIASTLGARIRAVRKAWGWSQADLAGALGNDQQIISYWERDKAKPTRSALQLLAATLQLSVEALTSGEGFTIPDLPQSAGVAGRMEALQRAASDLVPDVEPGSIRIVGLMSEPTKAITLREAKAYLERCHKAGCALLMIPLTDPME